MQSKNQKRLVALERIENRLLSQCEHVTDNPHMYTLYDNRALRLGNSKLLEYMQQANDIRQVLKMRTLSVSIYEASRGNLVITDGYSQFYPKEN